MKRIFSCSAMALCLFWLAGGISVAADDKPGDKPAEKKDAPKEPDLKLDVPSSVDVVLGNTIPLEVKVAPEGYEGPVKIKVTGLPDNKVLEATIGKGATSTKFEFVLQKEVDKLKLKVEASGGSLKSDAEVEVAYKKPNPTDSAGDAKAVGVDVPDPTAKKIKVTDPEKPDSKILLENQNTQQELMVAQNKYLVALGEYATKSRFATNMMWTLICGFLVMFMQAGFAMVETGLTRAKNVAHTMGMNFMVYALGMLGFYLVGFALMFGGTGTASTSLWGGSAKLLDSEYTIEVFGKTFGIFGYDGFFLTGRAFDVSIMALFLFQMVFMDTTATIPTGAMAERWKFLPFVVFAFFVSMLLYPVYGNWVWGGGWLSALGTNFGLGHGHVDFAGSSVVHMTGGVCALAGAIIIGPRLGKYNKDGSVNALPAHNVPMYMVGTFILAFGWFGFNPGSALQLGNDFIAPRAAVNTMLAGATGALASMVYMWVFYKKPDPSFMCNGMLAGLVAITAPCAFVTPWAACVIGLVAGVLVIWSCLFWEKVAKIDDPVGAISVHGVNGAWGIIALGLFADGTYGIGWNGAHWFKDPAGALHWVEDVAKAPKEWVETGVTGLFYGNPSQLYAQGVGIGANIVWVFTASFVFFWIVEKLMGNRVSAEVELQGLDIPEMGVLGYINEDPKTPEGHFSSTSAEPRPALAPPPKGGGRFVVTVQGADSDTLKETWSEMCKPSAGPPPKEFLLIYPQMTTMQGNRFRFRGGDPEVIRGSMERLLQGRMRSKTVRATVES
ncbi:MAG: ammonium transporter [Gemmataceae bacterium]|nr:ammonium transporter [Gemmataceae bacterium]